MLAISDLELPPQSNQRGIETGLGGEIDCPGLEASIEPAWD